MVVESPGNHPAGDSRQRGADTVMQYFACGMLAGIGFTILIVFLLCWGITIDVKRRK
jgi:hypothetical protein